MLTMIDITGILDAMKETVFAVLLTNKLAGTTWVAGVYSTRDEAEEIAKSKEWLADETAIQETEFTKKEQP